MPTVAFHTLGCKVNFYDTEGIWQVFQAAGYHQVEFDQVADVYVINTCTVTNTGDKKSRQMIRRAIRKNSEAIVAVTGCYAQVAPQEIAAIHGVDLVIGNDKKSKIVEYVEQARKEQQPFQHVDNILKVREFEELDVPYFEDRQRANLKIQDGCNHFCTFCLIPYARGLVRSRRPENILAQARKLAAAGYREIILTGIHTGGFGEDLTNYRLSDLLIDLEQIEGLHRIRISSIEASEIDDTLIDVLAHSAKVCHHLHIPLQAGHNEVLRRMNRHYTVEEFTQKLEKLRVALPELAITSDVIVGFPGETDEYFEATETLIAKQQFSELHVFPYSPRKGTPAAKFTDQVPADVKETRVSRLLAQSNHLAGKYAASFHNRELEVILEGPLRTADPDIQATLSGFENPDGVFVGHADNYLRVAVELPTHMNPQEWMGEVVRVRVVETDAIVQTGTFVEAVTSA
jgi:threonylcarbamoyladenosine tRNA methylthiotransferase MtaB